MIGIGVTVPRILLAGKMASDISSGKGIAWSLLGFVATDIGDGVLARKLGADTPLRRATDAVIDRASVALVATAVCRVNPVAIPFVIGLAAREVIVTGANYAHYRRTGEVVHGSGNIHKLGSLSLALFGAVAATGNETLTALTGLTSLGINVGLAFDYASNAIQPHGTVDEGVRHIAFDRNNKF